ncbi:uncharacterized protein [Penaeus vannamei]|uniref:uncharacterized protein n=1 Tax=Penaeus vannamei TaxID=6689 RepID=UPI00387F8F92
MHGSFEWQFIRNLAEVEGHFLVNDLRPAYQALRKLNSKPSSRMVAVDPRAFSLDESIVAITVLDPPINEDPPTLTESAVMSSGHGLLDLVHCELLWEILSLWGIPTWYLSKPIYWSEAPTPTFFNTSMDWIIGRATIQTHCGATLVNIKVTDFDFTYDVAVESLVMALKAFSNEATFLGLDVSQTKTKIQDIGGLL